MTGVWLLDITYDISRNLVRITEVVIFLAAICYPSAPIPLSYHDSQLQLKFTKCEKAEPDCSAKSCDRVFLSRRIIFFLGTTADDVIKFTACTACMDKRTLTLDCQSSRRLFTASIPPFSAVDPQNLVA